MYRAKILCHSVGPKNQPLMTVEVEFPRIVIAEVVTHRVCKDTFGEYEMICAERTTTEDMSKNSASSRAIPLWRMIQKVMDDPYVPEKFSKTGPGMQAAGWLEGADDFVARQDWIIARDEMVRVALGMTSVAERVKVYDHVESVRGLLSTTDPMTNGVHKQDVNRLLEPFAWITQVITADDAGWNNFFALRCHAAAHPALQKIARMVYLLYRTSVPRRLDWGQWHLPFVEFDPEFRFYPTAANGTDLPDPIRFSAARCGWVSYENHDKDGTPEAMRATFDRFLAGEVKHSSPVEHQACPMTDKMAELPELRSNLRGWLQARKLIRGERCDKYQPTEEEIASWGLPSE